MRDCSLGAYVAQPARTATRRGVTSGQGRRTRRIRSRARQGAARSRRRSSAVRRPRVDKFSISTTNANQKVVDQGRALRDVHRGQRDDRDRARHQRPGDLDRQRRHRARGREREVPRRAQEPRDRDRQAAVSAPRVRRASKGCVDLVLDRRRDQGADGRRCEHHRRGARHARRTTTQQDRHRRWCRASGSALAELHKVSTRAQGADRRLRRQRHQQRGGEGRSSPS